MYIDPRVKYWLFLPIVRKLGISGQTSEKYSNVKFHKNSFNGNQFVPCGQTEGHYEATSRFSQFCEIA